MEKTKQKKSFAKYCKSFWAYFKERNKKSVTLTVLMTLYVAFCIGSMIYFAIIGRGRDCLIGFSYLVIAPIFYLAEFNLKIRSPLPYTLFVLIFCTFCFLGASYNFYTTIPMLDDILHACWGILFSTLGFCIIKSLMGEPKTVKQFTAYLLFSIGFCMILSIAWEIYEYACDCLMPNFDMQEDVIVDHIYSFMLHKPYDHLHTLQINGIAYTQLFDKDGNLLYTIEGGYLDIGLNDTMMDIIWCVIFTCVLCIVLAIDRKLGGKLYPHIIPVYVGKEGKAEAENKQSAAEEVKEAAESGSGVEEIVNEKLNETETAADGAEKEDKERGTEQSGALAEDK